MMKTTQRRRSADPERVRVAIGDQANRLLRDYNRTRRDWRRFTFRMPDGTRLRVRDLFAERRPGAGLKRRRTQAPAGQPAAGSTPC
jgi:hypothetical protein